MTKPDVLLIGQKYIIDKGFTNEGEVILIKIYGDLFCRVKCPELGSEWDTMIYRLSDIYYQ